MLKLHNSMTKQVTPVKPLEPGEVRMYTCGPTVYRDVHIGNLRSYLMSDWIRRSLEAQGLSVTHVKNITDVGHMRQEELERGEDKVIAAAIAEGKTPQQIAQFYTEGFLADERKLNITPAEYFPKATDHIGEMIDIVQRLVELGYAYVVQGNVYFDVSKFPRYGQLSGNTVGRNLLKAARVEGDPLKWDPRDFTLWKMAEPGRDLKWHSPWGEGFPGWHIECSAMSMKYLGEEFDIHTGGVDNIFPHHEGEIAQSEGFTGKRVVETWVHGQHLLADGVKMAKSAGNTFTLTDIEERGLDPMAFRYLCLTVRYDTRLNFTFTSMRGAQMALQRLRNRVWQWESLPQWPQVPEDTRQLWEGRFFDSINDNLNLPRALAVTWQMLHSSLPEHYKRTALLKFDQVLGLGLAETSGRYAVPREVLTTVQNRSDLRLRRSYDEADDIRRELSETGYRLEDRRGGTRVRPLATWEGRKEPWETISAPSDIASMVHEPDAVDFTIGVVASNYVDDVGRCIQSALRWVGGRPAEVVVVDNGSTDETSEWLEEIASKDSRIRVTHTDHVLGEGAAKNVVLKLSRGQTIVLLDTSIELRGDIFGPILNTLKDESIGVVGPYGLRTNDLHHFHEGEGATGDVDAMQAYCFAFRRRRLLDVGFMREVFRFYRNLDLDYSLHFKDKGYRIVAMPDLPLQRHEHRAWANLGQRERDELSQKNFRKLLRKWGHREDLLVDSQRGT